MADSNAVVEHREESDVNIQLEQRRSQVRGLEIQLTRKEAELRRAKEEQALLKELHAVNEVTLRKKQQKESDGAGSRLKIPRESLDEILRLEGEIKCANRRTVELQNEASTTSVQLNDVEKGIESICNRTALVKQVTGWISSGSQSSSVVGVSSEWIMRKKVLTELQDEQNAIKALTALLDKQAEFYTKRLEEQRTKDEEFAEAQRVLREKTVQYENLLGELKSFERLTKKKERLLDTASGKVTDDYKTVKMIEGDKKVLYANLSKLQETNVRNSKSILSLEMRLRQLETKLEAVNLFLQQVFADVEEEDEHIENIPEGATEVPLEQFEELCRELELSRATLLHREEQLNAGDAKVEQLERKTTILENAIASHAVSAQLQVKGKEREFETLMSHVDYMKAEFDEEYKRLTKENAALVSKLGK
ncbi:hypothetical protein, conserved [Trypanosoma brucei gambiense DAL972]|uniref:Uncharacterized protein n=2 Tax=Trypanosoma brucei TaxID=5691 RepID=C9ZUY1_TRYB9|nr:hypothetical protein, conserved [Trypanosoma brucei gambiense DAL972]RHW71140.1 hypothetical protein DPX39_080020800 [Trypanosoma brucei equiperdum]CBH13219.1 hypothetical protein, conserved [Trypanosoma brucei gambiense DAL972]|eukprot:XP_011775496.1 hypothetical protein, conserved [Trypanosoma brucei gambiense DAL972]